MRRLPSGTQALALAVGAVMAAGCSGLRPTGSDQVMRGAELARVRCLIVAPFENASDAPLAADAATSAFLEGIDGERTKVFPVADLRAVFRDTPLELPPGLSPSLALELAELLGADAALYGAVEGRAHDGGSGGGLLVTVRIALAGDRHLLWASTARVSPRGGERPEAAVQRTAVEAARDVLPRLGDTGRKRCFEPERVKALREFALLEGKSTPPVVAPVPPPASAPVPASAAAGAAAAKPDGRTPRQTEWARRLAALGRIVVEDVGFAGRSANLSRDTGLADLAQALAAVPDVKVRLEGFVDATAEASADARLSNAMAQAASKRLVQLGVAEPRVTFAGRGGANPVLPNFTARGRAANRRIEAQALR